LAFVNGIESKKTEDNNMIRADLEKNGEDGEHVKIASM
jgi:hypothetical protein